GRRAALPARFIGDAGGCLSARGPPRNGARALWPVVGRLSKCGSNCPVSKEDPDVREGAQTNEQHHIAETKVELERTIQKAPLSKSVHPAPVLAQPCGGWNHLCLHLYRPGDREQSC